MLGQDQAMATIAVRDLEVARKFYSDTLGLKQVDQEGEEAITFKSGDSEITVYRSQFAGTNKATALTWSVPDTAAEVSELKAKGISFEHYDMPGLHLEGDVHVANEGSDMKAAWFKDPDGNILALVGH